MKIAIPTFATRVSPRFDCAQSVLVVTVDEVGVPERQELPAGDWARRNTSASRRSYASTNGT